MIDFLLRGMAFLLAGFPAEDRPYQLCGMEFMQACRKDTEYRKSDRSHDLFN
jgi:hypothetical protein